MLRKIQRIVAGYQTPTIDVYTSSNEHSKDNDETNILDAVPSTSKVSFKILLLSTVK